MAARTPIVAMLSVRNGNGERAGDALQFPGA